MRTGIGMLIFMFPVACTCVSPYRSAGFAPFLWTYTLLAIIWSLSVLLHEIGHVIAARAAGLEAYALLSGGGPAVLRRRLGRVAVEVRCLPGSGLTLIGSPAKRHVKWRLLACYAGGPIVTIALFLTGLAVERARHEFVANSTPWLSFGAALVMVNGFLLGTVIVPLPKSSNVGTPRNDFVQMLTLPWMPQERIDAIASVTVAAEFQRLVLLKEYDAAYQEARRLLTDAPGNWIVRIGIADLLMAAGLHSEAHENYSKVLEEGAIAEKAIHPDVRAIVANNCAWNIFMMCAPELMGTANELSAAALAALPNHPSVIGTRGAVLVEMGDLVEGQKLLRRAHHRHRDRFSKAANSACLAIAAARRSRHSEARRLIDRARKEDRECDLLDRAEREVGITTPRSS